MDENFGICEWCDEDVIYRPTMTGDEPDYPLWGFDEEAKRDFVYHQRHDKD